MKIIPLIAVIALASCTRGELTEKKIDPAAVSAVVGSQGTYDPAQSVVRFNHLRSEADVRIQGERIPAELALQGWLTLSGTHSKTTLLGNFPLLASEVNGFLKLAVDSGVVITALHNRLMDESPRLFSAHIEMLGTEEHVARAAGRIWGVFVANKIPQEATLARPSKLTPSQMDREKMEARLWKGELTAGVFTVSLGRATLLHGKSIGNSAGAASWAAFAGQESSAAVNADIATLESELPHLLRTILKSGLRVVSIHTHLTHETPRLVFVHVWGAGTAESLAKSIRDAIELKEEFQSQ